MRYTSRSLLDVTKHIFVYFPKSIMYYIMNGSCLSNVVDLLYISFIPFNIKIIFVTLYLPCLLKKYFQGLGLQRERLLMFGKYKYTVTKTNSIRDRECKRRSDTTGKKRLIKIFVFRMASETQKNIDVVLVLTNR